jgi:hypothetical protein
MALARQCFNPFVVVGQNIMTLAVFCPITYKIDNV